LLSLGADTRFGGVSEDDEKNDFVARSGNAAEGTASLRDAVVNHAGDTAWKALLNTPEKLDAIAAILTFRDDIGSIRAGLAKLELDQSVLDALATGIEEGRTFAAFKGAGHISAKACRAIMPYLREGLVYSAACAKAGYDHAARPQTRIDDINNPVAKKALSEALKQVKAIIRQYGLPKAIHVELARDVGKSKEERDEIRNGIEKRNKTKDWLRGQFLEDVGVEPSNAEDLLRYELWREQGGRCLYSDQAIHPDFIVASNRMVEVDHILPWSRSGDDSFVNKTLCFTKMNQDKRGMTPFEWFGKNDPKRWATFTAVIESTKGMKGRKKRNYLLKDATVLEEKFKPRNLTDTRYACRLLADELKRLYPDDGQRHVYTRPGPLTDRLRRAWGIQGLKKGLDGKRVADDRHHALDALIVAATTESALNRLTVMVQDAEARGDRRDFADFPPPWPDFARDAVQHHSTLFVARAERRRARGEGHAATIRRVVETEDGPVVYERKNVDALTLADLARIKDAERNSKLVGSLRTWIEAGKPKDARPLSPKGDPIAKVRLATNKKVDVLVRDGTAERGEMTRVDVFRKKNRRDAWEYFLVPIYPHQIFDEEDWPEPPNQAVQAYKPEAEWPAMTSAYEFLWSLYPRCFIEVQKADGTFYGGYFAGLHRTTGAINLFVHYSSDAAVEGIGARTLKVFQKYTVDRLGHRFEIEREKRTWHGAVCT
jgi:CRISPR-associated endonuclease Csn1